MSANFDLAAAEAFLKYAAGMIGKYKEGSIRHVLSSRLPALFPTPHGEQAPWWIEYHAKGSETLIRSHKDGKTKRGFIDTLVGSTAIEYEKDISSPPIFAEGYSQVVEYCAGLLNEDIPHENILGVLSDTVRWRAYRVKKVLAVSDISGATCYGVDHIQLEEIESLDLTAAGPLEAAQLGSFLEKYLGRLGGRLLGATTLASDLGFESEFCSGHIDGIRSLVDAAFLSNAAYASLIEKVWSNFVSYLGGSGAGGGFDRETYVGELYILTLAKLLCANVLDGKALVSDDDELKSIMDGSFFSAKGFSNLVEYDYFGWLNKDEHVKLLLPVARKIQKDLAAYDFGSPPAEDLFGALMAQLAKRSQRLLLGQEWTPAWLARIVVENVLSRIPKDAPPRLVDMCCGSGSMVVEAVKQTKARLESSGVNPSAESLTLLSQSITGFDIDPMAVMLSKVSWILAARDWLTQSEGFDIAIPIYHADSLFASTPVAKKVGADGEANHELDLDGRKVALPSFLVSSGSAALFDAILGKSYAVAMAAAKEKQTFVPGALPKGIVDEAAAKLKAALTKEQVAAAEDFVLALLMTLESLQRSGRNGIWAFVLSNSYRPGLVAADFNGLVSNPPWLAMSKVANNPYKDDLVKMSERFGIKPPGASHLHAELATIFLLHAARRYLSPGAAIGCVLPESIMSAHHHNPFRQAAYLTAKESVLLTPEEIWAVEKGTFKNEAVVLIGKKSVPVAGAVMSGKTVGPGGLANLPIHVVSQGNRTAWSNKPLSSAGAGFFDPAPFRQGADVFPRTAVFQQTTRNGARFDLSKIDRANGSLAYLVKDAKTHKDFHIVAKGVDGKYLFDVLLSNHLTPFDLAPPAKGWLPLERDKGAWIPASPVSIAKSGPSTQGAFSKFFSVAAANSFAYFSRIDTDRKKLSSQCFPQEGWLVVMGAGGKLVCAACADISDFDLEKLIIDQTLYWVVVPTEDEALYLTGLLNSEAINLVIEQFQPKGQFGERHIHTLPFGATPPYNSMDAAHTDVVAKTKLLIAQWKMDRAANPLVFKGLLDPNKFLSSRRTSLRARLKLLSGYPAYESACRSLYGV